ncbi:MAG: helix-turn-helix domain-containing protein [Actinomycetota bacterium]|nr:helix-turn-helix domain-containing protein [Actinomycetota bacterium]
MNSNRVPSAAAEQPGATAAAELVDIGWVANRLGVTVRHVRGLVADRRIPIVKWGHLLRFDPIEIESWIDSARRAADPVGAPAEPPATAQPRRRRGRSK